MEVGEDPDVELGSKMAEQQEQDEAGDFLYGKFSC